MLIRKLGSGGMGTAYLAVNPDTDELLVVKRLHRQLLEDQVSFRRFVHEAEVASHIRHPHLAPLVAMGRVEQEPFLATEYVFGLPWRKIVQRIEESIIDPVPLDIALLMATQLVSGLAGIHEAQHTENGEPLSLLHRDVGARNVLVGFDGGVRIIDLGLGKSNLSNWQTAYQEIAGSPDYMPPEQAMGRPVDARADIYSAAVTIWELIAGQKRIREASVADYLKRAITATPEPLCVYREEVSVRLEAILQRAMSPDVSTRTPRSRVLYEELQEERQRLRRQATQQDVQAWMDVACATVMARERRAVEEARALVTPQLRRIRSPTTILVQGRGPATMHSAAMGGHQPTGGERIRQLVSPSLADPRMWGFASLGLLVLVAFLTMWGLTRDEAVIDVKPLTAAKSVQSPPHLQKAASRPPVTMVSTAVPSERLQADPLGPASAPRRATKLSEPVRRKKRTLVARIRRLRTSRFDLAWQRKLTRVSTQLSRARTFQGLGEVEGTIRQLETQ